MLKKFQTTFISSRTPVTEKHYYEMLEALPPERQALNAFLVGEPTDHDSATGAPRFDLFFTEHDTTGALHYYAGGLATISDFETWIIPPDYCAHCGAPMFDGMCNAPLSKAD